MKVTFFPGVDKNDLDSGFMSEISWQKLHSAPYGGTNNRKWTLGRMKLMSKVQSIPIWEKDEYGRKIKFLGFKYVEH